ncbi:LacI family transcriptional regulator [Oscillochloris sp. ZM17-4]|uniref:LacI family DNA-binding transcriptional regulator n=1 Tax=Oscillochloris sp. ZM17-4 TaxID=2866714 RepID=UPI001C73CBA1|nr:LacI family DNA-binding transcriptional regulator [Oscillochloris sp. ZM17-4]MBX0329484.1 LacI family transcriptional regulator [Oscillochloris sp. ZM17-4]
MHEKQRRESTGVTIEEIARLADVSRSTVSRVLNNHPSVRPHVRERVLEVIRTQDYTPNAAARSLASARSRAISVVIPRSAAQIFTDPFFALALQGISEGCISGGYFLMLSMVTPDHEERFYNQVLRGQHFDGVLMLSSDIDDPLLPRLIRDRMPLVLIGQHPYLEGIVSVDVDNREGARLAVDHLIGLGYRDIATISGSLLMMAGQARRDGYKQALLAAGIPISPELLVEGGFSQEGGYIAMRSLIALPNRPRAVFVASDTMAIGALRAIAEAGLRVPEDIAVVGFDDLPTAAYASPPLSTVRQPIIELGAAAVRALIAQIESPEPQQRLQILPTQLVVRASCGARG